MTQRKVWKCLGEFIKINFYNTNRNFPLHFTKNLRNTNTFPSSSWMIWQYWSFYRSIVIVPGAYHFLTYLIEIWRLGGQISSFSNGLIYSSMYSIECINIRRQQGPLIWAEVSCRRHFCISNWSKRIWSPYL